MAALVAVLAVPTVSYAAAPDAVRSTLHRVTHLFPDDDPKVTPADGDDQVPATAPAANPQPLPGEDEPTSPEPGTTTGDDNHTGDSPAGTADDGTDGTTQPDDIDGTTQPDGTDDTTPTDDAVTPPPAVEADDDGTAFDSAPALTTIAPADEPEIDTAASPADS